LNNGHVITAAEALAGYVVPVADITGNLLVFTPATDNVTAQSFQFAVTDTLGNNTSSAATMAITVTSNASAEPTTTGGAVTTTEDHTYAFSIADFHFSDPADTVTADTLKSIKITSLPTNGTLTDNSHVITAAEATTGYVVLAADIASLVFTPATDNVTAQSFQFAVTDTLGNNTSSAATMAITVTSVAARVESVLTSVAADGQINHNTHDSLTITIHFNGIVTVINQTTTFLTFNNTETASYTRGTGTNTLVFTYSPGNSGNPSTTPDLTITQVNLNGATTTLTPAQANLEIGVNEAAGFGGVAIVTGVAGSITTTAGDSVNGTLASNDPDSDATFAIASQPPSADGTVTITNAHTGAFTFTPKSGFVGSGSFTFTVTDEGVTSAAATESFTVTTPPAGVAGSPINLALTDPSGGQATGPITLTFTGVPVRLAA
jgi:hypothetical protein